MLANGLTELPMSRHYSHLPMSREIHSRDAISFGTDLAGPLTDRIDWKAFLRWGMVEDDIKTTNMVGRNEWLLARDVTVDAAGNPICRNAAAHAAGCVPSNLFTTEAPSQAW